MCTTNPQLKFMVKRIQLFLVECDYYLLFCCSIEECISMSLTEFSRIIFRWGKLRMLEPYQPAYCAPTTARATSLPPTTIGAIVTPVQQTATTLQLHSDVDRSKTFGGKKRIDSLSSFRDNFREGYEDSHWKWNWTINKPVTTEVRLVDASDNGESVNLVKKKSSKNDQVSGLSPFGSNSNIRNYRRASSGSAAGLGIHTYDLGVGSREDILDSEFGLGLSSRVNNLRFGHGSRSNSIFGSNQSLFHDHINHFHHQRQRRLSHQYIPESKISSTSAMHDYRRSQYGCGSPSFSQHYQRHSQPPLFGTTAGGVGGTGGSISGKKSSAVPSTCITITNTEEEEELQGVEDKEYDSNVSSLNNSNIDLSRSSSGGYSQGGARSKRTGGRVTFREERVLGLKPLAPNMRVRSAVDLVSLVMQERRMQL